MKIINKLILGLAAVSLCIAAPFAAVAGPLENAYKKFATCSNSGAGVPTELAFSACITAFDALIAEAQKPQHSAKERRLLWANAGQSANLAMFLQLKTDNAQTKEAMLTDRVCSIALNGLKAFSQVKPKGTKDEMGGLFVPSSTQTTIHNLCTARKK